MQEYGADLECTGLLEDMKKQENPKLHNFCAHNMNTDVVFLWQNGEPKNKLQAFFDSAPKLYIHNGITFDTEVLQWFGYDISRCTIIDTLPLSWYLSPDVQKHGLEAWGERFGVPKPPIVDWESLTQEDYNHRVNEDCRIQKKLWLYQKAKLTELYGDKEGSYDKAVNLLMWKMEQLRMQQENKWKVDVPAAKTLLLELDAAIAQKTDALRAAMPKNPIYAKRSPPAKPYKKNGELSSTGERWKALTESLGLPFEHKGDVKEFVSEEEGNPASHTQIKAWLDSLGWQPQTFKFLRDKETGDVRQIPQVNLKGGEVCESVKELIEKCEGIAHLAGLGILNHRYAVVNGFIKNADENSEVIATAQGFTNTLRQQHAAPCVNLPSLRVQWGKEIRGLLLARDGKLLAGADESSLEDRLKHHFQYKLDKPYVESQMKKGYDPHLSVAVSAGLMTEDEAEFYKWYKANH